MKEEEKVFKVENGNVFLKMKYIREKSTSLLDEMATNLMIFFILNGEDATEDLEKNLHERVKKLVDTIFYSLLEMKPDKEDRQKVIIKCQSKIGKREIPLFPNIEWKEWEKEKENDS